MAIPVTGQITLKKEIKSTKFLDVVLPQQVYLHAFIDAQHRIYAQHPEKKGVYLLVKKSDIETATWSNGEEMLSKPKFYQAVLKPVKGDVIAHVYPKQAGTLTLEERLPNNGACTKCGKNEWIILPKECASTREGGKPYIECMNCGNLTHL